MRGHAPFPTRHAHLQATPSSHSSLPDISPAPLGSHAHLRATPHLQSHAHFPFFITRHKPRPQGSHAHLRATPHPKATPTSQTSFAARYKPRPLLQRPRPLPPIPSQPDISPAPDERPRPLPRKPRPPPSHAHFPVVNTRHKPRLLPKRPPPLWEATPTSEPRPLQLGQYLFSTRHKPRPLGEATPTSPVILQSQV